MQHRFAGILTATAAVIYKMGSSGAVTIDSTHPSWEEIRRLVRTGRYEEAMELGDVTRVVERWLARTGQQFVQLRNGAVLMNNEPLPDALLDVTLRLLKNGQPATPLINFLGLLALNNEPRSVEGLLRFVERYGLPLFEDGTFMAYKGLSHDWRDKHTSTVQYVRGGRVSMPRDRVDPDPNKACAPGLHVGSWDYASGWGEVVTAVRVDPRDVVRVPHDHDSAKIATCALIVLDQISEQRESGQVYGLDLEPYDRTGASVRVEQPGSFNPDEREIDEFEEEFDHWGEED